MEFYYFNGPFEDVFLDTLEDAGFSGIMLVYDPLLGDVFTKIAHNIKKTKKIKYLVAMRPYVISPQYLCMINESIKNIVPNRVQLNIISGHIKEHEKDFGGILGDVNDLSSKIDRSNYLIKYLDVVNNLKDVDERVKYPDFYVTTTNKFVFNKSNEYNNKMIISYRDYKNKHWMIHDEDGRMREGDNFDLSGKEIMIALVPILRKTQEELDLVDKSSEATDIDYFTYDQFKSLIKQLESENIKHLLVDGWPENERDEVIEFVKHYTELKGNKNNIPSLENNLGE